MLGKGKAAAPETPSLSLFWSTIGAFCSSEQPLLMLLLADISSLVSVLPINAPNTPALFISVQELQALVIFKLSSHTSQSHQISLTCESAVFEVSFTPCREVTSSFLKNLKVLFPSNYSPQLELVCSGAGCVSLGALLSACVLFNLNEG